MFCAIDPELARLLLSGERTDDQDGPGTWPPARPWGQARAALARLRLALPITTRP